MQRTKSISTIDRMTLFNLVILLSSYFLKFKKNVMNLAKDTIITMSTRILTILTVQTKIAFKI